MQPQQLLKNTKNGGKDYEKRFNFYPHAAARRNCPVPV